MRQTKPLDIGRTDDATLPLRSGPDLRAECWSTETSSRIASRRFATALQAQLALARVQILDAKRSLRDAAVELDRSRGLGIGVDIDVEKPRD